MIADRLLEAIHDVDVAHRRLDVERALDMLDEFTGTPAYAGLLRLADHMATGSHYYKWRAVRDFRAGGPVPTCNFCGLPSR